jgi:hypothetical protein
VVDKGIKDAFVRVNVHQRNVVEKIIINYVTQNGIAVHLAK